MTRADAQRRLPSFGAAGKTKKAPCVALAQLCMRTLQLPTVAVPAVAAAAVAACRSLVTTCTENKKTGNVKK